MVKGQFQSPLRDQHTCTSLSLQPPLPNQTQKPVAPFPEKESSRDIAMHLTVYDWNLFTNIHQMEFIYHMFGRHKFGKITTNLDLLLSRFNLVSYCARPTQNML